MNRLCGTCGKVHTSSRELGQCLKEHGGAHEHSAKPTGNGHRFGGGIVISEIGGSAYIEDVLTLVDLILTN